MAKKKSTQKRRIKQSPKLPAEQRRKQILAAAYALFNKKGYQATTTAEIARAAGLTKGALYFHFKGKEDVLLAFVKRIIDVHAVELERIKDVHLTPTDLLAEMRRIDKAMPLPEDRRNLTLLGEIIRIKRFRKMMDDAYEQSIDTMAEHLDPTFGKTKRQRRRVVELLHALYDGINFASMIHPQLGDLDRQAETLSKLVGERGK